MYIVIALNKMEKFYIMTYTYTYSGFRMFVSDSGEQVLIATCQLEFYLWEMGVKMPQWWKLFPPDAVLLPQSSYKETSMDAGFFMHQVRTSLRMHLRIAPPFLRDV